MKTIQKAPPDFVRQISRQVRARNTFCWDNALDALEWLIAHQPQCPKTFYIEGFLLWQGVSLAHGWLEMHTCHRIQIVDVTPASMNDPATNYIVGIRYNTKVAQSLSRSDLPFAESIHKAWHPAYVRAYKRASKAAKQVS